MSNHFPIATLAIGRDLIRDRAASILAAIKTDDPAAWDYAMYQAQEIAAAAKTAHVELRHYHESKAQTFQVEVNTPEEDAAMDELEARFNELHPQTKAALEQKLDQEIREEEAKSTLHPVFDSLLAPFRRPA